MIDNLLLDHPFIVAHPDLAKRVGEVSEHVASLYQTIGRKYWERDDAKPIASPQNDRRFCDMIEVVSRVAPMAGGVAQALTWYRSQPIPALGDQTAQYLVNAGETDRLRAYIDGLDVGSFA